ncbi:dipeptidase PepV [Tissierella praeacuta]|uniref:dipeptidase PepV n=1 Tax=Tissierella praeacuta TaxID=43131 RepID=UPI001C105D6A|nr:dipeptidase PepV [Tissierella praeacuta]MBU5257382.1 dipeptidase PepV [Tissierella praeacuta]
MNYINLIDGYKEEIVKSTQEIIKIKSVEDEAKPNMPFGEGPYKALEYALELSKSLGFKTKNLEGYAGYAEFGEGDESVGVLVHLDVVPEGTGWTYPPYGAEIHDDKIFGRGTIDDKGPAIATIYAMKALKESEVSLNRKIRVIFGTNEETGWGCMDYYFKHEKPPTMAFTPDADFPVIHGEKGIIVFDLVQKLNSNGCCGIKLIDLKGGNAPNMVPDYAEAVLEVQNIDKFEEKFKQYKKEKDNMITMDIKDNIVKVIAKGISAHGSTPEKGENAISYLMNALSYLMDGECDICDFINLYNERIGFKHYGEGIGCGYEDSISGKLNFNPGLIKLEGDKIKLTINVRYPIKSSAKEVYDGIRKNLNGTKVELVEGKGDTKPLYVAKDNFLVEKLMKVYREQTGDLEREPITIGGGTYARAMENAVAFGPMFPGQPDVAHQKDEYISIEHLIKITKIYAHALYELAK